MAQLNELGKNALRPVWFLAQLFWTTWLLFVELYLVVSRWLSLVRQWTFWSLLRELIFLVGQLRVPIIAIICGWITFWYTDQFAEVLLGYLVGRGGGTRLYWSMLFLNCGGVLVAIYAAGILGTYARSGSDPERARQIVSLAHGALLFRDSTVLYRYAPHAIGILFIAVPLSVMWLRVPEFGFGDPAFQDVHSLKHQERMAWATAIAILGFVVVWMAANLERAVTVYIDNGYRNVKLIRKRLLFGLAPLTIIALVWALLVSLAFKPDLLSSRFGALGVMACALWVYAVALMAIQDLTSARRFPFIGGMVLFALWSGLTGQLEENELPIANAKDGYHQKAKQVIDCYEDSNKNIRCKIDGVQPATKRDLIVAAQGGGAYAAYHSALSLARLEDACPGFSTRIYALTGVSGGSLGIAVFLAALDAVRSAKHEPDANLSGLSCTASPKQVGPHEELVHDFFVQDLLTPVIAAGLFIDLPHHLLHYKTWVPPQVSGLERWPDRANALENAIARAWALALKKQYPNSFNHFENYFEKHISDTTGFGGHGPLPIFGAVISETGEPLIISPVRFSRNPSDRYRFLHISQIANVEKLTVARAVVLSSRFPVVTPSARLPNANRIPRLGDAVRIVDGGIFENSAIKIVRDLLEAVNSDWLANCRGDACNEDGTGAARFSVITFGHKVDKPYPASGFREIMTPITALLNAKTARGFDYERELIWLQDHRHIRRVFPYTLGDGDFAPPLGWLLADLTRARIEARAGLFDQSNPERGRRSNYLPYLSKKDEAGIKRNNETASSIVQHIQK